MRLYTDLADWFHLLSHPSEYEEEAADYTRIIKGALPSARTLLELGSGGGGNALHMKADFECTLSDLSPQMLALSQTVNPELEHIEGDMRSLRLGREFDCVFIHDAIEYMTTIEDLAAAIETAYIHTRPGGVALFVPDSTQETFEPGTNHGGSDGDDGRSMRFLEWTLPPEPGTNTYRVHFVLALKDGESIRIEHDPQDFALFSAGQWLDLLTAAGFTVERPPLDPEEHGTQVAFLCRKGVYRTVRLGSRGNAPILSPRFRGKGDHQVRTRARSCGRAVMIASGEWPAGSSWRNSWVRTPRMPSDCGPRTSSRTRSPTNAVSLAATPRSARAWR